MNSRQKKTRDKPAAVPLDVETLLFPYQITEPVGLPKNEINSFKGKGCRFYGKKTSVAWVREYLRKITDPSPSGNGSASSTA